MRYGFTADGFVVLDDERRIGEFAYWSSPNWNRAKRDPEGAARHMLDDTWRGCPDWLREERYAKLSQQLECSTRHHVTA